MLPSAPAEETRGRKEVRTDLRMRGSQILKRRRQGRISRGVHRLSKLSLGCAMLYQSMPCGWPPLKKALCCVIGGHLHLSLPPRIPLPYAPEPKRYFWYTLNDFRLMKETLTCVHGRWLMKAMKGALETTRCLLPVYLCISSLDAVGDFTFYGESHQKLLKIIN
jgi:hypothetical protein